MRSHSLSSLHRISSLGWEPNPSFPLRLYQRLNRLEAVGASLFDRREHRAAAGEEIVARVVHDRKVEAGQEVLEFLERVPAAVHLHGVPVQVYGVVEGLGAGGKVRGISHDGIDEYRFRRADGLRDR